MQYSFIVIILTQNKKGDNKHQVKRNKRDKNLHTTCVFGEYISYRCITNYFKTQWLKILSIDYLLASPWVSFWCQLDCLDVYSQLWIK